MSGISTGSVFYKPAMMILWAANAADKIIRSSAACVFSGSAAVRKYNQYHEELMLKNISIRSQKLKSLIHSNIRNQQLMFEKSLNSSYEAIIRTQKNIAESSEILTHKGLDSFRMMLDNSVTDIKEKVNDINDTFQKDYIQVINSSDAYLTDSMNEMKTNVNEYLDSLDNSLEQKTEYEKEHASEVISDAEALLACAAGCGIDGLDIQKRQLESAQTDFDSQHYQSSMSLASNVCPSQAKL